MNWIYVEAFRWKNELIKISKISKYLYSLGVIFELTSVEIKLFRIDFSRNQTFDILSAINCVDYIYIFKTLD